MTRSAPLPRTLLHLALFVTVASCGGDDFHSTPCGPGMHYDAQSGTSDGCTPDANDGAAGSAGTSTMGGAGQDGAAGSIAGRAGSAGTAGATANAGQAGVAGGAGVAGLSGGGGTGGAGADGAAGSAALPEPVKLATGQANITSIAVDDNNVYWSTAKNPNATGTIFSMPKNGGEPTPLATDVGPYELVLDYKGNLYWKSFAGATIKSVPTGGGAVTTRVSDAKYVTSFRLDTTYIYWTDMADIFEAPVEGGTRTSLVSGQQGITELIFANSYYWLDVVDGILYNLPSSKTGSPKAILSGLKQPMGLLTSKNYDRLFWTEADGTLRRFETTGGAAIPITSGLSSPFGAALDDAFVYWSDPGAQVIARVAQNGGTMQVLSRDRDNPGNIAVDQTSIYWAENGAGQILKLDK